MLGCFSVGHGAMFAVGQGDEICCRSLLSFFLENCIFVYCTVGHGASLAVVQGRRIGVQEWVL